MNNTPGTEFTNLIHDNAFLGRVGHTLCCRHTILLARAFGDLMSPEGDATFAVGHDTRESSPSLAEAVSLGLRSGGHHVIHIDACTTPQLEWYVAQKELRGGIMITGHCAPQDWNGLHLCGIRAQPVTAKAVLDAMQMDDLNAVFSRACNPVLRHDNPLASYAACLRQQLQPEQPVKLCLDVRGGPVNDEFKAMVSHFQQIRYWHVNVQPDSVALSDPFAQQSRAKLTDCVLSKGCHLGAAIDADGDRLAITDDHGTAVAPHVAGIILGQALARRLPELCVYHDAAVSDNAIKLMQQAGMRPQEVNGGPQAAWPLLHDGRPGFYFNDEGEYAFSAFPGTANALMALIFLINYLTETGLSLSAMVDTIKQQCPRI